jgi:SLT domain-containing protein/murein DD-endopeptidase MepM/ murein hydrolase activator NlpD/phage-related protein
MSQAYKVAFVSKQNVLTKMNNAVKDGGEKLQGFAKVSGMSGQEFAETWKKDPYAAVQAFEKGLAGQNKEGKNVKAMLKDLGITELRETDTVLRLANGNKQLDLARQNANKGYKEGNALSQEAETKYKTLGNQMKIFMNHVRALGIEIGSALAPILIGMMKVLTPIIDALAKAPAPIKLMVVALGLIPVVAVPVLASLAGITGALGLMGQAMNTATVAAGSNGRALKIYAATMGMLTNPIGTLKNALDVIPGKMARTSKATNVLKGNTIAAGTGLGSMITPMGRLSTQAGKTGTTVGMAGTAMATSGKKASFASRLFSFFGSKLKLLAPLGSLLTSAFTALVAVLGAVSAPIWIAIGAVVAIGGAFVIAYKKVKWFRDGVNGLWYTMKVFGGGILGAVFKPLKALGGLFAWLGGTAIKKATKGIQGWYSSLDKDDLLVKSAGALQKFGNGFKNVMKTLGSATHKASDTTKVLGKGVSKGTKAALKNYVKYSEDTTRVMARIKNNNGKATKEMQEQLINATKKGGEEAVKQVKSRNKKISNQLNNMLKDSKAFTQSEKDDMISKNQKASDEKVKKLESLNDEIAVLEEKQFNDGKLTEKEAAKLKSKLDERNKLTIKYLSQGQKEQQAILSRLNANTGALDTQEAADAIKESIKARNKAIKEAKKQRTDDTIEADSLLDAGAITKKEHEKRIKEINKQYNKTKKEANKKASEIKGNIRKNNDDIDSEIDMSTGKVYTGAEKWWKEYTNGVKKRFNDSMKSIVDFGGWIMDVKKKANSFWANFGSALMSGLSSVGGWVKTQSSQFGTAFINGIMNTGSWIVSVKAKANAFWSAFGSAIMSGLSTIGSWFTNVGSTLWGWIKTGWSFAVTNGFTLWNTLKTVALIAWTGVSGWFVSMGGKLWSAIKQGWNTWITTQGNLWTSLITALGMTWAAIRAWFVTKGQQMGSALSQGWTAMKGFVVGTFNSIWTSVKVVWQGIWGTITYWTGAIWNRVKIVWTWIKNNTVYAFTAVWNTIKSIWSGIKNTIVYWTSAIWNRIKSVWGWIKTNTLAAFSYVWNTVKRIWAGIKGTIVYWTGAIWNRIKAVWSWIKSNTLGAFNYVWNTIKRIWKGIKGTITYWTGAIWNRVKGVWSWIKSSTASSFTWVWNKIKSIWKGIKGTITYWTGAIWNRVKGVWSWIRSSTSSTFNWVWNKIKSIWKGIKGTITYWTGAIWNSVKSIWNSIKSHTYNIFNAIWNKLKSIWKSIFGTIKYWMNQIWNKVRNGWNAIKKHTVNMVTGAKNAVVDKFKGMYNGAKSWIDRIGSYIDNAKKWMKGKAVSLGKSVANGAISGLNKMIGGINKISKAITSKKLMHEIKPLHTGTRKGAPKSNSKGQLRKPTTAIVNDKGQGNGKGPNGHQEIIQKSNGQMFAPKGKNVIVGLEKGDTVHSGKDTQAMQSQGIIPQFSKGSKKKKKYGISDALGGVSKGIGDKISDGYHSGKQATKDAFDTVKKGGAKVLEKGKDAAGWLGDKIGDVMDYVKNPGKLVNKMMDGISFGKENKTMEIAGLAFSKLKKSLVDKVKSWFEEAEGGDGDAGWLLKHKILQTFGSYTGGLMFNGGRHYGIDFAMPTGTSIKALTDGKITQAGPVSGGGGNQVTLQEPGGKWFQWYMHMSKVLAHKGDKVKAGDEIGKSGSTGNSTTPHLHIQRMKGYPSNATAVNPMKWLKSLGSTNKSAKKWKSDIQRAAKQMKVNLSGRELNGIIAQIQRESNGNAGVTQGNIGDINNLRGTPAQGLLQYVPSTFKSYAVKGHKNIKSGYDQLLAFFNNKNWRKDLPYGKSGWGPTGGRRYAHGGMIKKHGLYEAGEGNRPEMVLPLTNKVRAMQLIDQAKSFMGVDDEGDITTVDSSSSDTLVAQLLEQNNKLLEALISTVQNKELIVDEQAITNTASKGLGKKYNSNKYNRGGR